MSTTTTVSETREPSRHDPNSLSFREAWKLSKIPYVELIYKSSQLMANPSSARSDTKRAFRSMLNTAKGNRLGLSIIACLGAAIPFLVYANSPSEFLLAGAVALSLTISFAYLLIYCLQVLPSYESAEVFSLLLTLPFNEGDFSMVSTLSFVRAFDYLATGLILVPLASVAALTRSLGASIIMLGASAINVALAIFVGLWLSRLFYKNMTRGGRSKGARASRTAFLITWGFAVLCMGFSFYFVTPLLQFVDQIFTGGFSHAYGIALLLLHPLTFGLGISMLVSPNLSPSGGFGIGSIGFAALSYSAMIGYLIVAFLAVTKTARAISTLTRVRVVAVVREKTTDFTLKLHSPFYSYITKDVRIASKNPATAFLFAFPLLELVIIVAMFSKQAAGTILDIMVLTMIGSVTSLLAGSILLSTETRGLQYTLSLPLSRRIIVNSKSIIATLIYLPIPIALVFVLHAITGAWRVTSLFPSIQILAVGAAIPAEINVLISGNRSKTDGVDSPRMNVRPEGANSESLQPPAMISGRTFGRTIKAYAVAFLLTVMPASSYFVLSIGFGTTVSIIVMALVAALEFAAVQFALRTKR